MLTPDEAVEVLHALGLVTGSVMGGSTGSGTMIPFKLGSGHRVMLMWMGGERWWMESMAIKDERGRPIKHEVVPATKEGLIAQFEQLKRILN